MISVKKFYKKTVWNKDLKFRTFSNVSACDIVCSSLLDAEEFRTEHLPVSKFFFSSKSSFFTFPRCHVALISNYHTHTHTHTQDLRYRRLFAVCRQRQPSLLLSIRINKGSLYQNVSKDNVSWSCCLKSCSWKRSDTCRLWLWKSRKKLDRPRSTLAILSRNC